MKKASMSNCQT